MTTSFARLSTGWQTFWFRPCPTSTLALFRIAFGVLVALWTLSFAPLLPVFFGAASALPEAGAQGPGVWSLLTLTGNTLGAAIAIWLVLLLAAVALALGYRTRLAAVLVFVGLMTVERHTPLVGNTGDGLLRILAFYLMFSPAGDALSLDRWRLDRERFWEFPERAPWALRLMQVQLSVVYLGTVWEKLQGETWRTGTAVSYSLRALEVQRVPPPSVVVESLALSQLMTLGTLALELALGILVWNRAARPWVLALGVVLHLSIEVSITVGFFSLTMLTLYLVFLPPDRATQLVELVRARRRRAVSSGEQPDPPATLRA
jgi:Vitamin K-dependent gamma-carboxylase